MVQVKWFDTDMSGLIIRKFNGEPIAETETTITIMYRKQALTLKKEECFIYRA